MAERTLIFTNQFMASYKILRRLEILIELLKNRPEISKADILDRLLERHEIEISERTLERDLKSLSDEFQIDVIYNKQTNGYSLDLENQKRVQSLLKYMELIHVGELFKQGLEDFDLMRDKIELEDSSKLKGIGQLKDILLAIKKNKKISFIHENYWENTQKDYTITPLLLKEYLNRWYVVGVPIKGSGILTFGIDRIHDIKIGKVSKKKRKNYEADLDQFINIIGLNYKAHDRVENIVLKVNAKQIKYLESLPLHHSQNIDLVEGADYGLVNYNLIPNYELEMEILKLNSMVEVVEPVWFREKITGMVREMLAKYE